MGVWGVWFRGGKGRLRSGNTSHPFAEIGADRGDLLPGFYDEWMAQEQAGEAAPGGA